MNDVNNLKKDIVCFKSFQIELKKNNTEIKNILNFFDSVDNIEKEFLIGRETHLMFFINLISEKYDLNFDQKWHIVDINDQITNYFKSLEVEFQKKLEEFDGTKDFHLWYERFKDLLGSRNGKQLPLQVDQL